MLEAAQPDNVTAEPVISARGLSKAYGPVQALSGVSIEFFPGEVHALAGENGAGKSTLTRLLGGEERPDAGSILAGGQELVLNRPADARRAGIAVVHQQFELVEALTVAENICLEAPLSCFGGVPILDRAAMLRRAARQLAPFGMEHKAGVRVRDLTVAEKQVVEISKALARDARLLILDEPASALSRDETETLFEHMRRLRARGVAILFIGHSLGDVLAIADRITVLRDGKVVAAAPAHTLDAPALARLIVGREITRHERAAAVSAGGDAVLEASVEGTPITAARGEILALPTHIGSAVKGLLDRLRGERREKRQPVRLAGTDITRWSVAERVRAGVCFVSGDTAAEGLVPKLSIEDNFLLPNIRRFTRFGIIRRRTARAAISKLIADLDIRPADPSVPVERLSGGNRQKVAIGKWLLSGAQVLILDDPMRGVDVGAKAELYRVLGSHAAGGGVTVLASSDLDELLGLADHLVVLRGERVEAQFRDRPLDKAAVLAALTA